MLLEYREGALSISLKGLLRCNAPRYVLVTKQKKKAAADWRHVLRGVVSQQMLLSDAGLQFFSLRVTTRVL